LHKIITKKKKTCNKKWLTQRITQKLARNWENGGKIGAKGGRLEGNLRTIRSSPPKSYNANIRKKCWKYRKFEKLITFYGNHVTLGFSASNCLVVLWKCIHCFLRLVMVRLLLNGVQISEISMWLVSIYFRVAFFFFKIKHMKG